MASVIQIRFGKRVGALVLGFYGILCLVSCNGTPTGSSENRLAGVVASPILKDTHPPQLEGKIVSAGSINPEPEAQDFVEDARLIFRVAACMGDTPLPPGMDRAVVDEHCAEFRPRIERYRKYYRERIEPFFASVISPKLPEAVVYPFGGGDLLSALNTYPRAAEISTLSLELAGDPRRLRGLDSSRLRETLAIFRRQVSGLLSQNNSTSEVLQNAQRGELPGQLAFFITALAVRDLEPVGLRYFQLQSDGSVHYLNKTEIRSLEDRSAHQRKPTWIPPDFSEAFANSELTFRRRGEGSAKPVVHRHLAANLADSSLRRESGVLKYLEQRGRIAAMTKAASYMLWNPSFSVIRKYLLESMDFMVSDSTGIPPHFAQSAGFVQETYGAFQGSFLEADAEYNKEFRELWQSQPSRKMPFRYGYPDSAKALHLLITRKSAP